MSIPVTLVAGFLGAGKTTLINRLLQDNAGLAIAAIINDFGSINIDAALIAENGDEVIGLKNGCICCSLQGDLMRTLKAVIGNGRPIDHIVIEASGVSDPQGIVEVLLDPVVREAALLDAIVTVVDAEALADTPALADDPLWQAQLRAGDFIAISKASAAGATALEEKLRLEGKALVFAADEPPTLAVLGSKAPTRAVLADRPVITQDRFVTVEWTWQGEVSPQKFQACIEALAPRLIRAKGILNLIGFESAHNFNLVGRRATMVPLARRHDTCQLVLIGERGTFDPEAARVMLLETFADMNPAGRHG